MLGVAWGGSFSLSKIALEGGGHPLAINWMVSLVSTVLLTLYVLIARRKVPTDRNHLYVYFICGALGTAIPGVLYFYALRVVSPGILAIMMATIPIMTYVVAIMRGLELKSMRRLVGGFLGVISVMLLIVPNESLPERAAVLWVVVMLLATACYAAENIILASRVPAKSNAYVILWGMSVASTLMMTPFVLGTGTFFVMEIPWSREDWAIFALSVIGVLCYGSFVLLILRAGPVFASQTAYIITISGVGWGILIFNDRHSLWVWASLLVMLGALALVTPKNIEGNQ